MATALPAPPSKSWWPRLPSSRDQTAAGSPYRSESYVGGIPTRPHTASGAPRPPLMTSVTNPKSTSTSSNAFMSPKSSSSKFNFASVIGFGSKSKKHQPVDIQDPPSQVRSLPIPKSTTHRQFGVPSTPAAPNPRFSRGVASSMSGTSRASTDVPLTPEDLAPGSRISYPQSLMTLTDLGDPFAGNSPLSDRRTSAHSDKSMTKRLMHKADSKAARTAARLPVGDGSKRKDSRDRSATMPSRARTATDASEAYQPLRAVEPPWAPESGSAASSQLDSQGTVRGTPSSGVLRRSKSSKPPLPWPGHDARTRPAPVLPSSSAHQRSHSVSSLSKKNAPDKSPGSASLSPAPSQETDRTAATSSTRTSTSSSLYAPPASFDSGPTVVSSRPATSSTEAPYPFSPHKTPTVSAQGTPTITTQFPLLHPRPPPTHELPPTPSQASSTPPPRLHPTPEHPLRARSGTVASTSAVSFASSLSSLSFNSRPSPQDPPPRDAYEYPSLMAESLPVPGTENDIERRGSNSGSSLSSTNDPKPNASASGHIAKPNGSSSRRSPKRVGASESTPKQVKPSLPTSRPLPSPPVPASPPYYVRERAMSATSSTFSLSFEGGKTLRKQRSFHNTSLQTHTQLPTLRHYNSFEPQLRSPPLPPPSDLPPPPPPLPSTPSSASKRGSGGGGKESLASPRRRLFSSQKHERERKTELGNGDMSSSANGVYHPVLHHSSSWFDEGGAEPAPTPTPTPSTGYDVAQHIVPPAELLRLGAAWERESESLSLHGTRTAKSSWDSRDSSSSRMSSSSRLPISPRSAIRPLPSPSIMSTGSKLPRSSSVLSKASSAPSFARARASPDVPFVPSAPTSPESYTSLSPPPRRQQRMVYRPSGSSPSVQGLPPPPPRRPLPNATTLNGPTTPPPPVKGALIERKPSFLDMTTRRSVSLDVPDNNEPEPERDSFLELSRGMDSIDTIRESEASFVQQ